MVVLLENSAEIGIVLKQGSKQTNCEKAFVENACRFSSYYMAVYKQIWDKLGSFQINHPGSHSVIILLSINLLF